MEPLPETLVAPRSPRLLSRADSALLVIDVQEKLLPAIPSRARLTWNLRRLIDGAKLLSVPTAVSEQYPKGLGPTVAALAEGLPTPAVKTMFSCRECAAVWTGWKESGVRTILLAGIETHVCVLQTAFDLLESGFGVQLAVDAVASRNSLDHDVALRRMVHSGVVPTTVESALFEWCETASAPEFKSISRLVREAPPTDEP